MDPQYQVMPSAPVAGKKQPLPVQGTPIAYETSAYGTKQPLPVSGPPIQYETSAYGATKPLPVQGEPIQYQTSAYQAPQAQPYQAPASTPAIGTTGIEFGGGQFQWTDLGGGVYGYQAPDGRTFDSAGNPHQQPSAANGWVGRTSEQAGFGAGQVWNGSAWVPSNQPPTGGAAYTQTGPAGLQAAANPLVDYFKTHSGTNVSAFNFNKMKSSTQDLVLGAAEAAGQDKADVYQDIQRTLPRAVGPRTGYVAPMGTR